MRGDGSEATRNVRGISRCAKVNVNAAQEATLHVLRRAEAVDILLLSATYYLLLTTYYPCTTPNTQGLG